MANTGFEWLSVVFATKTVGGSADWDGIAITNGNVQQTTLIDLDVKASIEITLELTMAAGTINAPLDIKFLREIGGQIQTIGDAFGITWEVIAGASHERAFSFDASQWSKIALYIGNATNVDISTSFVQYKLSSVPVAS